MKVPMPRRTAAVTFALLFLGTTAASADPSTRNEIRLKVQRQCQGKFIDKAPAREELKTVFEKHRQWLSDGGKPRDPGRANLCRADLRNIDWSSVDMRGVDLSGARLQGDDVNGANLSGADLSGADLSRADLSGAFLLDADLGGADLSGADLSGARLSGADVGGVVFEPKNLPDVDDIAYARNLSQMSFSASPQALVRLRTAFKDAGYYRQEREMTYAIKHTQAFPGGSWWSSVHRLDRAFQYVFFDLTTQWGMRPGRALLILLILIPVFAVPYGIALRLPGPDGIWRRWADDRIRRDLGTKEPTRLRVGWLQAPALGLYFSVLSAFNIGWRELTVGNWIQRLQADEYTLQATGWVRTVAGVQSLVSVYLLAIWALTYFGRPFE